MSKSYDESKHVRNRLGQYDNKIKESKPGELPEDTLGAGEYYEGGTLRDMNLAGADVHDLDLSSCDLSGADLTGANLSGSAACDCALTYADFTGANLTSAAFDDCDLSNSTGLDEANLTDMAMSRCDLTDTGCTPLDGSLSRATRDLTFSECEFGERGGYTAVYTRAMDDGGQLSAQAMLYDPDAQSDWKSEHRHHLQVADSATPARAFTGREDIRTQVTAHLIASEGDCNPCVADAMGEHLDKFVDWDTGCWKHTDIPASFATVSEDDWTGLVEQYTADIGSYQ